MASQSQPVTAQTSLATQSAEPSGKSGAETVYHALLRAERALEEWPARDPTMSAHDARLGFLIIQTIRHEVGQGLATTSPGRAATTPETLTP
jgi:hypothetical protein